MKFLVENILSQRSLLRYPFLAILFVFIHGCTIVTENKEHIAKNVEYLTFSKETECFTVADLQQVAPIIISESDYSGVNKVAALFQNDILQVTNQKPQLLIDSLPDVNQIILIGSIEKNSYIKQLADRGKINRNEIMGKWETSVIKVLDNPFPNIKKALVITGSDKRGVIYGMFDISRKMGVSPWYWWADVPIKKHKQIFIKKGRYNFGEPKVKYRGIFLNDEAPALTGWADEKFGGYNHQFYDKVFELILRLKGNYLWPAMWGSAFYDDDPKNGELANEYGIVMGTSHHEPLGRAHAEWKRYGSGSWDYSKNKETLDKFWKEGMQRMKDWDKIVTVGMRGDGDESMSEETNTELLERIVANQRKIIEEVTGEPAEKTPQLWALYKEVQEYYDKGMRVPDDVTLLLCDDNWGNVRRLPDIDQPERSGGYGMYYHFDYVGGPRNYKWLNTKIIPRVWEQMHLSYKYGVDQIWIVNVGDLKPMELPISFFLDYAWNPEKMGINEMHQYTTKWAQEQFGEENAEQIANILNLYTKYNSRKTPEMLYSNTYSLTNYREFERVSNDYKSLAQKSEELYNSLPNQQKAAYYQLVHFPVLACSNLYELYYTHALNIQYAEQGRKQTNKLALKVEELFTRDAELTNYFHNELADGKWNHMMAQTHIGYTYWQQPDINSMPKTSQIELPDKGSMGVWVEGSDVYWSFNNQQELNLPEFDNINDQHFYFEIFNRGKKNFEFEILAKDSWIKVSENNGIIEDQKRIVVNIDWSKLKKGSHYSKLIIKSDNQPDVEILINAMKVDKNQVVRGFVERNGYVSMEANHYTSKLDNHGIEWKVIPGLSRTESGVSTFPVTKSLNTEVTSMPTLNYDFYLLHDPENEEVELSLYLSPTLNFKGMDGLHFAVSVDDQSPIVINMHKGMDVPDWKYPYWFNSAVGNNVIIKKVKLKVNKQGPHTLNYYMIDGGVILQKLVIDNGGLKVSYLGAPESIIVND